MQEIWLPIEEFPNYEVSNLGRIKSIDRYVNHWKGGLKFNKGKIRTLYNKDNKSYSYVNLVKDGKTKTFLVHRLVAKTFITNPENKENVNHINGIKTDNRVENLEWCTQKENIKHSLDNKLQILDFKGEKNNMAKLTKSDVIEIRYNYENNINFNRKEISKQYNITEHAIYCVVTYRSWKD